MRTCIALCAVLSPQLLLHVVLSGPIAAVNGLFVTQSHLLRSPEGHSTLAEPASSQHGLNAESDSRSYGDVWLSASTIVDARRASAGCSQVAFTSVDTIGRHPTIVPPRTRDHGRCVFVFVGQQTQLNPSPVGYRYLINQRTMRTRTFSLRRFSKVVKLSPDILFPGKWTVFFDTKLHMQVSMDELYDLYTATHMPGIRKTQSLAFTAFNHPQVAGKCGNPFLWMQMEAEILLRGHAPRVEHAATLRAQIVRYVNESLIPTGPPARAYTAYIEGALLMQKDATEMFAPWRQEFLRTDSSDRDQISFAYVVAKRRMRPHLIPSPCVEHPHERGRRFCGWFPARRARDNDTVVALIKSINFESKTPRRHQHR